MTFVVGVTVVAQDRFALKAANGIACSEFKRYDAWQMIATSQPGEPADAALRRQGARR